MNARVKICGIKRLEEAEASINSGADFLGFNFVKTSKRYIDPKLVKEIIKSIAGNAKTVGVFQDEDKSRVKEIAEFLELDYVQMHKQNIEKVAKEIRATILNGRSFKTEFYLVDRKIQGRDNPVNLNKAEQIAIQYPIFLAGGLTPENIYEAILKVKPFAVDVASGVETDGKKDLRKIEEFIKRAKEASYEN